MQIKNKEYLVEQLTEILMDFDKQCHSYHTDVYMYFDFTTKTAKLDTFPNPGNCSWLDDGHWTIYTDLPHSETAEDYFNDLEFIADTLGVTMEQLANEAKKFYKYEPDEDISDGDVIFYVNHDMENQEYQEKLIKEYSSYIEGNRNEYVENAERIIDDFERTPYYKQFDDYDGYPALIGTVEISDETLKRLNKYIDLYDKTNEGLSEEDIKEHLENEGIIICSRFTGYDTIDEKKLSSAIKNIKDKKEFSKTETTR